jgi:valyl-tRNA synthetase
MSKSKGNVIDPLTVIENYGTDAFRYTLASLAAQGRDIKMSEKRVEGYRHFINKLWNASRFALSHMNNENIRFELNGPSPAGLFLPDKWIFSRLSKVAHVVEKALENYRFNDAAGALYQFVWHEFCDWYIEAIKPVLYNKDNVGDTHASVYVLWRTLCEILVLLHPFIPFVTEEIWQKLPGTDGSIMKASFSLENLKAKGIVSDPEAELHMDLVTGIITGIRNIRGEMNISPSSLLSAVVQLKDESDFEVINRCEGIIVNLARLGSFSARNQVERPKSSATAVVGGATIFVLLEGIIDFEKEVIRLEKEMSKISKELNVILKKLNNQDFLSKAPEDVVDKVREKQHVLYEKQQKIEANLEKIKGLTLEF